MVAAFGVFFITLFHDFVFDDIQNILGNRWIKDIRYIPDIFSNHMAGFLSGYATNYYRPLVHLIYMLNYHLFGLHPWGFHLVNILFHVAVSVLVFMIASRLLEGKYDATSLLSPPLIAALLFATHPIHTEAVSWVSGIMDISFSFFYLLSFFLYLRSWDDGPRLSGTYFFSVATYFLSVLCKEPGLTLPAVLFLYDRTFRKDQLSLSTYRKRYLPYLLVAIFYMVMRALALNGFAPSNNFRGLNEFQLILSVFSLFIDYVGKLLLPVNLNVLHPFQPVFSAFELKSILSIILLFAFAIISFMMRREKVVVVALSFLVIPLLPSLYIPGITGESVFYERYLYLPSFGYVLLIAFFLSRAKENFPKSVYLHFYTIIFLLIGTYSYGAVHRNIVWRNNHTLWEDAANKSPGNAAAHEYLGYALYAEGEIDEAIEEYRISLTLSPDRADAHINLGLAYHSKGWIDRAIEQYMIGLGLQPDDAVGNLNIGLAYISKGWVEQAIERCQHAIRIDPYLADAHNCLGSAYANKGLMDEAIEHFREAVQRNPGNAIFRENMEKAYRIKNGR